MVVLAAEADLLVPALPALAQVVGPAPADLVAGSAAAGGDGGGSVVVGAGSVEYRVPRAVE